MLLRPLAGGSWPPLRAVSQCATTSGGNGSAGLPLLLQTTKGKPAKGCTNMEWESVMQQFQQAAAAATSSAAWRAAFGHASPIWSFDNDRIHQNTLTLASLKINTKNRFPLPPNSPDMHRVIERCVGRLKDKFQAWLYDHPAPRDATDYQDALREVFTSSQTKVATPNVIRGEVEKLPTLWPMILERGGDWPPKDQL